MKFLRRKGSSIAALKLTPKHTSNTERIALQKYKLFLKTFFKIKIIKNILLIQ